MSGVTTILSIQSRSPTVTWATAATFPLMRLGVEVWPVVTVHFSNHTGYGVARPAAVGH